jgi:ATP-dependent Clp protease ATP-binding subunit ClpB
LDEGHLTDGLGRTVNFRNTIIILTSNLGSEFFLNTSLSKKSIHLEVMKIVRASFRPELLNRLDEILVFNNLSTQEMQGIVEIQLQDLAIRLEEKKISIIFGDPLKAWLCEVGYDPIYGARPLKRAIQKHVCDLIARKIIAGDLTEGTHVKIDHQGEQVIAALHNPQ